MCCVKSQSLSEGHLDRETKEFTIAWVVYLKSVTNAGEMKVPSAQKDVILAKIWGLGRHSF